MGMDRDEAFTTLWPIDGFEFVKETVAALGSSSELATHLFRECWAVGTQYYRAVSLGFQVRAMSSSATLRDCFRNSSAEKESSEGARALTGSSTPSGADSLMGRRLSLSRAT
jgi:hypothetical protein